jgi:2,3-bisphosphoglycerate-dependent phosphoglycerate mutase
MSRNLTRLCLIRHGETAWNAQRRIQGQIDIELNAEGLRQAQAAGDYLKDEQFAALYASDLARAWVTAQRIGRVAGLPIRPAPELRERKYGLFEGLTYEEAGQRHPECFARMEARQPDFAFPEGGESLRQLYERVVDRLREIAAAHQGETVAVVTHGGVLDIVNRFVRGNDLSVPRDFHVPNAGLNWLQVVGDEWRIESWGLTAHLATALDEL